CLTPELISEIQRLKDTPDKKDAYYLPRLNNYLGRWLKHGGWYPDASVRLFDKTKGGWKTISVHEFWERQDEHVQVGTLQNHMLHYSIQSFEQHLKKIEKYSELSAQYAGEIGKKVSKIKA